MKKPRSESVLGPLLLSLLVLRLCGCASEPRAAGKTTGTGAGAPGLAPIASSPQAAPPDAAGTRVNLPPAPPEPPAPPMPVIRVLQTGDGWRRIKVTGDAEDGATGMVRPLHDEYTVIDGRAAIDRTPLPAATRQALADSMRTAPAPTDGDDEIMIVPGRVAEMVEAQGATRTRCADEERTLAKRYTVDRVYNHHKIGTGGFAGVADLNTRVKGQVTGTIKYTIKHASCAAFAVIRRVILSGSTDVVATTSLDAKFADGWAWSQEVYTPVLGTVTLPGLDIPVTFKAPITVGLDASAAAQLHASGNFEAHGYFDVRCNAGGCAGTRTATHGYTPGEIPTATVNGQAQVTPWAEAGVRVSVIDESLVHAQVGVRAQLQSDLWGYAGNACGDADHNGTEETVTATTIDLGVGIDVVAKAGRLGRDEAPWFWTVASRHLAFWSQGNDSAIAPVFYAEGIASSGAVTVRVGMRPCWPYPDPVTYLVTWSDGATDLVTGAPGTLLSLPHRFANAEARLLRLDALSDAAGRTLGASTLRSLSFRGSDRAAVADLR